MPTSVTRLMSLLSRPQIITINRNGERLRDMAQANKDKGQHVIESEDMQVKIVLFVATVYSHLAMFHIPFMRLLQNMGYVVHAAASPAEGHKEEVEAAGVTCWNIPFTRSITSCDNWRAYWKLRTLLSKKRFDLVHVHTPVAAWFARLASKSTHQRPVLYTAHGFHFYKGAPWRYWLIYYTAERIAARWTDGLIVINEDDLANARKMGFVLGKNLFYVHGVGVDLERFKPASDISLFIRQELGLIENNVVVTCVADFISNKNHSFLLTAWKRVALKEPRARLLLLGDGKLYGAMGERVQKENIPRVQFLGFRKDVHQILQESDILVLVSKREGLSKCIMEAMATGKPVVATNVRGNRDLVEHGVTGFLVELGDVQGLVKALIRLIRDPDLSCRMGEAGRDKIQDYALERVLGEMKEIYSRYL